MSIANGAMSPIEKSLLGTYHAALWTPFCQAIRQYGLIAPGDRLAVCLSGGLSSLLLAKLVQLYARTEGGTFEAFFFAPDGEGSLAFPISAKQTLAEWSVPCVFLPGTPTPDPADAAQAATGCAACTLAWQKALTQAAKEAGCSKLALGNHYDDVIEITLMSLFYGGGLRGLRPREPVQGEEGMEWIRPLYRARAFSIHAWTRAWNLQDMRPACPRAEKDPAFALCGRTATRQTMRGLIRQLHKTNPQLEENIFSSIHTVEVETFPREYTPEDA